ncbi:MAG: hypothetical protein ACRYFX_12920 [Janthinobacterium lividum]
MNISRASTISLKVFVHEHESLSKLIQLTTASLWYLEKTSTDGFAPSLVTLFADYVPYWGRPPISELNEVRRNEFTSELGRLGIIRVISAFDHYISSLLSELDSISVLFVEKVQASNKDSDMVDDDKPPRLIAFCKRIGLEITEKQEVLSEFINILRNCCAHRAGRASKKLVDMLGNEHVVDALDIKSNANGKKRWTANFPKLYPGDVIPISPVHAIWASIVCLEIAKEINTFIANKIGLHGLLGLAIYSLPKCYYLGKRKRANKFDTPQAAVNFILSLMLITDTNEVETVRVLKKEGLWDKAVTRFSQVKLDA